MLMQLLVTVVLAAGLAPCVLQRACPARRPRPPSTVCMHRIPSARTDRKLLINKYLLSLSFATVVPVCCDARAHKSRRKGWRARVVLAALHWVSLVEVLLLVSLLLSPDRHMTCSRALALLALVAITQQATTGCKNCIMLGKEEKAMFRAHSAACAAWSRVEARAVDALLAGQLQDSPALRRHVYCVLLKCKLLSKDGKLQKAALRGKLAARPDAKNATKVLESCAEQTGDTPEDLAWNLFRCGYDKKALLFDYMPTNVAVESDNTS